MIGETSLHKNKQERYGFILKKTKKEDSSSCLLLLIVTFVRSINKRNEKNPYRLTSIFFSIRAILFCTETKDTTQSKKAKGANGRTDCCRIALSKYVRSDGKSDVCRQYGGR